MAEGTREYKHYSYELKIKAVRDFKSGCTRAEVMKKYGITSEGTLKNWVRMYNANGEDVHSFIASATTDHRLHQVFQNLSTRVV